MKKVYFLLLLLLAAGLQAGAAASDAVRRAGSAARAATALDHDWRPAGTGVYTDDLMPSLFGGFGSASYDVAVEADAANPGYYRITDPYVSHPSYTLFETVGYVSAGRHYITIDATDPRNVIVEPSLIGLHIADGELMVYSYSWLAAGGDAEVTEDYVDTHALRGKLVDGIITFAGHGALWLTTPELDKSASGWNANRNGAFRLLLPGAKDYAVEVATEGWCTGADHSLIVSAWTGADVAFARLAAVADPDDKAAVDAALAAAPRVNPREGTVLTMPAGTGPRAKVYVVAAAYDADGNEHGRASTHCYTPDTSTGWAPLPGKARFTDDIVSNLFSDIDLGCRDIDVEQSTAEPGRYRLVDPYLGVSYNTIDGYHGAHSHYIYIDATDPDCVVLEESATGMGTIDYGHVAVTSQSWRMLAEGKTLAEIKEAGYGGVMRDGVITFPNPRELVAAFHTESAAQWYHVNCGRDSSGNIIAGRMSVDIGAADLTDIAADSTEAVYYNLQGMRLGSPEPGSIVIERRGGKARTVRF